MTTATTETGIAVADFLLERLQEDHDTAWGGAPSPWTMGLTRNGLNDVLDRHDNRTATCFYGGTLGHVIRFDPTAVLKSIEARQAVVRRCAEDGGPLAFAVLGDLAQEYADHEDYDPRWPL